MSAMIHPIFTASDRATMTVSELAFFTDEPIAQAVAYRDYLKARQIETRNAEITEYMARRDHNLAGFFAEAANTPFASVGVY